MSQRRQQTMRRAAVIAAASAIGMSVVGCGAGGPASRGERATAPTTMSVAQARAMMTGFDKRLDAAIKKGINPSFDETAWRAVNADGMLASNIYNTRIFKAARDSRPAPTWHHTVKSVIGRTRSGGRDTVMLRGRATFHQKAGGKAKKQNVPFDALWVMERTSSSGEWKLADQLSLEGATLPHRKHRRSTPSVSESPFAVHPPKAVGAVINGFQLDQFDGLADGKAITNAKKQIQVASDIDDNYSCYPRSTEPGTTAVKPASPDLVILDEKAPALVVLRLRCDVEHWARDKDSGMTVPPAQAKVDGLPHSVTHAAEGYAMTVLLSVPMKDRPAVLEVSSHRVLRKGAPHPLTPQGRLA